jgi:negative regulator of flagellin synthesis FlgM
MQIYGATQVHGPQTISAPHQTRGVSADSLRPSSLGSDELHISDAGKILGLVNQLPDIRSDRVSQIRAQIASGQYETNDKLSQALDSFLDEIG